MVIARMTVFDDYGCYFAGDLVVVDYSAYAESLPRHGEFGSMTYLDGLDKAKELVSATFDGFEVLLGIPILVVRIT